MELEFDRDTIVCYETAAAVTLCQEETLESIVPDACPDIMRIVDVCGQAVLTGKQAREGLAVVSGLVRAWILYQPEGDRDCGVWRSACPSPARRRPPA